MEKISLKQWIVAGALSGSVIGILVFFIVASIFIFVFSSYEVEIVKFSHLIFTCFHYVFYGVIIGIVLFLIHNKLQRRKLFKCLFVAIGIVVGLPIVLGIIFKSLLFGVYINFFAAPFFIYLLLTEIIYSLFPLPWSWWVLFLYLFPLLVAAVFGFLINYFINRMERKMRKDTGQT